MHTVEHQSEKKELQVSLWSVSWQNTTGPQLPFSHMGLSIINKLSKLSADHSLCSTASKFLCSLSPSPHLSTHQEASERLWPWLHPTWPHKPHWEAQSTFVPRATGEEVENSTTGPAKWDVCSLRLMATAHCFQRLQAQIDKGKNVLWQCEPLAACTTFSFSSLVRIARKILKQILCADLLFPVFFLFSFFFFFFFSPAFKYGLFCSIKMQFLLRTSRWSVSQPQSYNFPSAAPGKMKNRDKTF